MDYLNSINNEISFGTTRSVIQKTTKSSGASFVAKLREQIELELREEYEQKLANYLLSGNIPAPKSTLTRDEYIAQQMEIIHKQYTRILALCDNSFHNPQITTELVIAKKLYAQS